jgi:hypothetical protein
VWFGVSHKHKTCSLARSLAQGKKKGSKPGSNARKARPGFEGKKIAA